MVGSRWEAPADLNQPCEWGEPCCYWLGNGQVRSLVDTSYVIHPQMDRRMVWAVPCGWIWGLFLKEWAGQLLLGHHSHGSLKSSLPSLLELAGVLRTPLCLKSLSPHLWSQAVNQVVEIRLLWKPTSRNPSLLLDHLSPSEDCYLLTWGIWKSFWWQTWPYLPAAREYV